MMAREFPKALLLFSGGLDSILAARVLQKQSIEVVGLALASFFFDAEQARESARAAGIELLVEDISKAHLEIVRSPKYGRGKAMNPCLDCHALMIRRAWEIKKKENFDILASGEVLGQRPFSQNKMAFDRLKKVLGAEIEILRPLSARRLEETSWEKAGLVRRGELFGITGRGRKEQLKLADELGVLDFPTPSGGCILTEVEFGKKLGNYFENCPVSRPRDFELLRLGRHFWPPSGWIVLGRNQEENEKLEKLAQSKDLVLEREDRKGPVALIIPWSDGRVEKLVVEAKKLVLDYSKGECEVETREV